MTDAERLTLAQRSSDLMRPSAFVVAVLDWLTQNGTALILSYGDDGPSWLVLWTTKGHQYSGRSPELVRELVRALANRGEGALGECFDAAEARLRVWNSA